MTEAQLQRAVADFLKISLPPEVVFHHSPNESPAGKGWLGKMKGFGTLAGFPDIILFWKGRGIAIELKAGKGRPRLSAVQEQVHLQLRLAGVVTTTCYSLEDVVSFLAVLGVPLRGRVMV